MYVLIHQSRCLSGEPVWHLPFVLINRSHSSAIDNRLHRTLDLINPSHLWSSASSQLQLLLYKSFPGCLNFLRLSRTTYSEDIKSNWNLMPCMNKWSFGTDVFVAVVSRRVAPLQGPCKGVGVSFVQLIEAGQVVSLWALARWCLHQLFQKIS